MIEGKWERNETSGDHKGRLPGISVVIPTLNAARVLRECLESIYQQDYPKDLVEVLIVDGGSSDRTLGIVQTFAKRSTFLLKVFDNQLKTGEAAKAIGVRKAKNDVIAFIDSDNILPCDNWLTEMMKPFDDEAITAAEPIAFTYRESDNYINRYCALLGMNDPLCLFTGNYDRLCCITNRWTGFPVEQQDCGTYLRVTLRGNAIPTIGANGFVIRRSVIESLCHSQYLFDVDVLQDAVRKQGSVVVAKVKTGIIHLFCNNYGAFVKKQKRRVIDYLRYRGRERAPDTWNSSRIGGVTLFILSTLTIFPVLVQSVVGFTRRRDVCWLFHLSSCLTTLGVYGWYSLKGLAGLGTEMSREHWSQ